MRRGSPGGLFGSTLTAREWAGERLRHPDARLFFSLFLGEMMARDPAAVSVLRSELHHLLKRIISYLVRWARRKYRRLAPFKRVKRRWDDLLRRNRGLFAHWQYTGTFEWTR